MYLHQLMNPAKNYSYQKICMNPNSHPYGASRCMALSTFYLLDKYCYSFVEYSCNLLIPLLFLIHLVSSYFDYSSMNHLLPIVNICYYFFAPFNPLQIQTCFKYSIHLHLQLHLQALSYIINFPIIILITRFC